MRALLQQAEATLAAAGVASPRYDATQLAAFLLDCEPLEVGFIQLHELPVRQRVKMERDFRQLIARRATREPLQHILGFSWFGPLRLRVGPGVFIPRPETELLADFALSWLRQFGGNPPVASSNSSHRGLIKPRVNQPNRSELTVVDLCAGSGAISGYIAHGLEESGIAARVIAVELSVEAVRYTRENLHQYQVEVIHGDATDLTVLSDVMGACDAVVSNPPYVPETTTLSAEVYADPAVAVFSGTDGMELIPRLVPVMKQLARPGGLIVLEHDDSTQQQVVACVESEGFTSVVAHTDWAAKPRFVSAIKPTC